MAVPTAETQKPSRGNPLPRSLVIGLVALVVIYWVSVDRPPRSVPVAGKSMIPTLWGPSYRWECPACEFPLRRDIQDRGKQTTCPNCGDQHTVRTGRRRPADRVRVSRGGDSEPLQRWDVIAFRRPDADQFPRSERYLVKRVVGLPGEEVTLRSGEVLVDGQQVGKPLEVFEQLKVRVLDHFCQAKEHRLTPTRWLPDNSVSSWTARPRFRYGAEYPELNERFYLFHTPAIPGLATAPGKPLSGIVDYYPANQDLPRPRLHQVRDLLVELDVRIEGQARWSLELVRDESVVAVRLDRSGGRLTLERDGEVVAESSLGDPVRGDYWSLSLAAWDSQLVLKLDDQQLRAAPLSDDSTPAATVTLRMAASGGEVEISRFQLWRDVHWLGLDMTDKPWSLGRRLAKDEYLVLGDNPPVSVDSRQWQAGIHAAQILGRVHKIE